MNAQNPQNLPMRLSPVPEPPQAQEPERVHSQPDPTSAITGGIVAALAAAGAIAALIARSRSTERL
ncbi:hypothetical protein OHB01_15105 [Microbispora hainanensis]|uniref:Uncharacterized protein n=1 Tax=Microbispora hainanensis TaxID=568844 RepID=A0ABZ1SIT1_9ACTN|nr:hypothetical protein [Microbispora hainanensis]